MNQHKYEVSDEEMASLVKTLPELPDDDEPDFDEDEPDFEADLIEAGWNILHENPGLDCQEWINELLEQYPAEVVDALGNNPPEVFSTLTDWWEGKEYTDPETGEWHTLGEWAEYFATDRSGKLYDMLVDAKREIRRLEALLKRR